MKKGNLPRSVPIVREDEGAASRLARLGPRSLLDAELVDIIADGITTRAAMIEERGGLAWVSSEVDPLALSAVFGTAFGPRILCIAEAMRRTRERQAGKMLADKMDQPEKVFERLSPLAEGLAVEKCWVLPLNRRNRPLCSALAVEVTSGTATSSLLHPREVYRIALRFGAAAVIIAHNHPSGDPEPSHADRAVTRQLVEAGKVCGVECLDHIVLGRVEADPKGTGFYSFGANGLI